MAEEKLKVLQVGGVDYNVGYSENDLTNELKQQYDTAAEQAAAASEGLNGLELVERTEDLEANVRAVYQLVDKDGTARGAAVKVYKDSSLKSVTLTDEQKLAFTYILEDGTESTVEVDVSRFLAETEFQDGLAVDANGMVNVALGSDGESSRNFLELETDEATGRKVLVVRGMEATKTVTSAAIPIAGGPLASLVSSTLGSEIAAGTDLESLLFSLFCKEMWPTGIKTTDATLVSKVGNPTVTMSTTTVEVGTEVAYKVTNGASSYTATPHKATGFTYGYSADNDNTKDSSDTSVQASFSTIAIEGDNETTLTVEKDLAGTTSSETEVGTAAAASAEISGVIVAAQGTNTVKAKNTSVKYAGTCSELAVHYGCSNLGKTSDSYKSTAKASVRKTSVVVTSGYVTKSFIGALKYYIGYADAIPTADANGEVTDQLKALDAHTGFMNNSGDTTISTGGTLPAGKKMIIAVPGGGMMELKSILNGFALESKESFTLSTGMYKLPNAELFEYNIYCFESAADWNYGTIVLTSNE